MLSSVFPLLPFYPISPTILPAFPHCSACALLLQWCLYNSVIAFESQPWNRWWFLEGTGVVGEGPAGWAVIRAQHSVDTGRISFSHWIIKVGSLSMFACDQSAKLCKDIEKEVDTVFDPNAQRFDSSLDAGHMFSYPFSSALFCRRRAQWLQWILGICHDHMRARGSMSSSYRQFSYLNLSRAKF